MPELRINLDPCNPGQFYASCGLSELFELVGWATVSRFELDCLLPHKASFVVSSDEELQLAELILMLRSSECRTVERATPKATKSTSAPNDGETGGKDKTAPLELSLKDRRFALNWWLDEFWYENSPLKLWAGPQGSGQTFTKFCKLLPTAVEGEKMFAFSASAQGPFGVDPRSAWNALDLGYSPNEQKDKDVRTYPLVEVLAAIGLQGFRPRGDRKIGLSYCLWLETLPASVARAACMQPWDGLAHAAYSFRLEGRGSYKFFSFAERVSLAQE